MLSPHAKLLLSVTRNIQTYYGSVYSSSIDYECCGEGARITDRDMSPYAVDVRPGGYHQQSARQLGVGRGRRGSVRGYGRGPRLCACRGERLHCIRPESRATIRSQSPQKVIQISGTVVDGSGAVIAGASVMLRLRVYAGRTAQHLMSFDRFKLLMIEQPLWSDDFYFHARLQKRITDGVMLWMRQFTALVTPKLRWS